MTIRWNCKLHKQQCYGEAEYRITSNFSTKKTILLGFHLLHPKHGCDCEHFLGLLWHIQADGDLLPRRPLRYQWKWSPNCEQTHHPVLLLDYWITKATTRQPLISYIEGRQIGEAAKSRAGSLWLMTQEVRGEFKAAFGTAVYNYFRWFKMCSLTWIVRNTSMFARTPNAIASHWTLLETSPTRMSSCSLPSTVIQVSSHLNINFAIHFFRDPIKCHNHSVGYIAWCHRNSQQYERATLGGRCHWILR